MDTNNSEEPIPSFGLTAFVAAKSYHRDLLEAVIYSLEEGMNEKAIDLLCQVSYAGISTLPRKGAKKDIYVPPPEVLSIITTLSLHPAFTTRQTGTSDRSTALKASRYLRTIIRLAGATNCKLQQAWNFRRMEATSNPEEGDNTTRRMRNRNVNKVGAVGSRKGKKLNSVDIDTTPFANLVIANEESLFRSCDDIWALVGWALVCSCCYKKRWDYWRSFLDLLLETIQADFQERIEAVDNADDVDLEGSLITAIGLLPNMVGGAGYKRIARAIFANGSDKSRNEWSPVFKKETKKPPKKENIKEWTSTLELDLYGAKKGSTDDVARTVDEESEAYKEFRAKLAQGAYDDYDGADEESEEDATKVLIKKDDKTKLETNKEALEAWGGMDSIILRQKLMCLVSAIGAVRDASEEKKKRLQDKAVPPRKRRKKSHTPSSDDSQNADSPTASQQPLDPAAAGTDGGKPAAAIDEVPANGSTSYSTSRPDNLEATSTAKPPKNQASSEALSQISLHLPLSQNFNEEEPTSAAQPSLKLTPNTHKPLPLPSRLPHSHSFPSHLLPNPFRYRSPTILQKLPADPNNPQMTWIFAHDRETLRCFYEEYVDYVRAMPVKQMSLFTSSGVYPTIDPAFRATLLTQTLQKSMVWQPKFGWTTDVIDDESLRDWYLPHFARGQDVEGQVKMAILVEYLARLWHVNTPEGTGLRWSPKMQRAADDGIRVRREKVEVALKKRKKRTEADEELLEMLGMAEGRLRLLMGQAKAMTEEREKNM
ncbi:hypothetical protein ABW19_dt0205225 [Dactylella cylindrospora]|nr:hypothetical protein ABW19_dt0205225 [Dactylella cylindrospora]